MTDWKVTFYCKCGLGFKATGNGEADRLGAERAKAIMQEMCQGDGHGETDAVHARRARNRKDASEVRRG